MAKNVTVDFNANVTRFTSGIDKALSDLSRFQTNADRMNNNLSKSFNALGTTLRTFGVALSVGAFANFIKSSIDLQDRINDLNKTTKISVETLSGLGLAAKQSGGDLESIASSIAKLEVNIGKNAEKFEKLGVSSKDPIEAFKQLADITNAIEDPTKRAAVAAEALGKSWQGAAPLLSEGSAKIQEMIDKGKDLSGITTESAKAADEFNDKLEELSASAGAVGTKFANVIMPPLTDFFGLIQRGISDTATLTEKLKLMATFIAPGFALPFFGGGDEPSGPSASGKIKKAGNPAKSEKTDQQVCEFTGGYWYDGVCNASPKKKPSSSKGTSGPNLALESANATAQLTQEIAKLNDVEKDEIALLQEKLDAYTNMDPALKAYNQGIIDVAKAVSIAAADQEAFNKGLENEAEAFNEILETEAALQEQQSQNYTSMAEELERTNSELNVALIKDDKKRAIAQLKIDNDLQVAKIQNMNLTNEQIDDLLAQQAENYELKVNEQLATTKSLAKDLGLTFTSAFEDAIVGGKKFSDVLSGIDQDIERMLIRRTVTEPLGNLVDGLISGFDFGSLFNANGNAFNSSGVMKFANGGIFNSATAFKFANGGQMSNGILGEAGPEAILPLTRGKNGKLGVASEGGGSNVTVNVINNAGGVSTEVQKKEDGQGNISLDIIIDKIEASMSRNIKQGRGIAPAMETQYGLNRVAGVY